MRSGRLSVCLGLVILAAATGAAATGTARADVAGELARLTGHRAVLAPDGKSVRILDVAGEGAPEVGVVERRGRALFLRRSDGSAIALAGPLAVPRIAGPGYKVWVLGRTDPRGVLRARRLGVLARPEPSATETR